MPLTTQKTCFINYRYATHNVENMFSTSIFYSAHLQSIIVIVQHAQQRIDLAGQDLTEFLREHPTGSSIKITVVRDAQFLISLEATLIERP